MSTTEYPSSLGYNEKVPVSESGNTSPSSPKSRRFSNSTEAGSARPFIHWVRPAKPTKSPTVSGGSNASYSPEDVKLDEGWPLLAQVMEKNPEFEAFARFRELNVKNLLYYQVELDYLGDMLRMQELRDSNPVARHATDQKFSKFPVEMIQQYEDEQSKDGKYTGEHCWQWDYVLRIRRCLREYNEALLQYAQVSALPEANGREMETLTEWIINPQGGRYSISSYGAQVWGKLYEYVDEKKGIRDLMERLWDGLKDIVLFWGPRSSAPRTRSDLVVPRPGVKADAVAAWITYALVPWLSDLVLALRGKPRENRFSGKREENITSLRVGSVNKFTSLVATAIACALPTAAIAVLTTTLAVTNQQKMLWIGGFTILFAIGIVAFTSEISKAHVFMAAATFSAVMVVFVHN